MVNLKRFIQTDDFLTAIDQKENFAALVTSPRFQAGMVTIEGHSYVSEECVRWMRSRADAPPDLVQKVAAFLAAIDRARS